MRLPVTLKLQPSPTLATALFLVHGLVAVETTSAGLSGTIAAPVLALILVSLCLSVRRHVYRLPVLALTLKADGTLEVERRGDSCCVAGGIDPRTTVFPWLVVLLLRIENRNVSLVLLPDALGREGHRQLRLWLSWKASVATA